MTGTGFDLGLDDPQQSGVYFVISDDITTLDMAARDAGLEARRFDLRDCADKATLQLRLVNGLDAPGGGGRNWDALSDRLRDLSWLPGQGFALLFDDADHLRNNDETSFDTLLEILEEAANEWRERDVPFWAFLALPESEFDTGDVEE